MFSWKTICSSCLLCSAVVVSLISTAAAGPHATEILGLTLTVTGLGAVGLGEDVNVTATGLGINAEPTEGTDDTDAFGAGLNEFVTLRFNQDVLITQLDFTTFDLGDVFDFAGNIINTIDLTNASTDVFDFVSPFAISANTDFTLRATTGTIGIEAFDVQAVPETSTLGLLTLGAVALFRRRIGGASVCS